MKHKFLQNLWNERRLQNCFSAILNDVRASYDGQAVFSLISDKPVGYAVVADNVNAEYPLDVRVGISELCERNDDELSFKNMSWPQLTFFVVGLYHECRHIDQFGEMQSDDSIDMRYMALNHMECHDAGMYNVRNRSKFVTEIDAERAGISDAGKFLSEHFQNDKRAEQMLLDYVNARVDFGGYFIRAPKGKSAYDNMDDVLAAFDLAYENAKHAHRDYLIPGCMDPNYQFMQDNMTGSARDMLYLEPDGARQSAMMSAIVLYRHPEYKGWHKSLRNMDLSMETMFGENWRRIDKPKSVRRLPDVSVDTYDPLGQYEP